MFKGLDNLGNTCYMNSVLQLIINDNNISEYLKKNSHLPVISEFVNFMNEYSESNNSLSPKKLKKIIEKYNPMFKGYQQHDANELLLTIFNMIKSQNKLPFEFTMEQTIKCKLRTCLTVTKPKYETMFNLYLYVNNIESLKQAFLCNKREKLGSYEDVGNRYYCGKCKEKRIAVKYNKIYTYPETLLIVLNRFTIMGKLNHNIETLRDFLINDNHYKLVGFILHYGSCNGGHYVYVGYKNNNWFLCNDSSISLINDIEVLQKMINQAYILQYNKI